VTNPRPETLIDTDWGDIWESLPEAPPLVPRPKTTQITLRVPPSSVARLKAIARARSLPYHALARAWIVDGLRSSEAPISTLDTDEPQAAQLNLKVEQDQLDALKQRARYFRRPYHALGRQYIEAALEREEKELGIGPSSHPWPSMRDLMVLLLHAPGSRGAEAIHGMTRLQKLLFVIEHKVTAGQHFYGYNYGPFDEAVHDAVSALRLAGFLGGSTRLRAAPPTFEEMMQSATVRSGPREAGVPEVFELNAEGHEAAERLRRANRAYEVLFERIAEIRQEWDSPNIDDLVDRVYAEWPEYTEKSLIKHEVAERASRRYSGS
jgi:predicted DNA binding CopG/RHH family protein